MNKYTIVKRRTQTDLEINLSHDVGCYFGYVCIGYHLPGPFWGVTEEIEAYLPG